MTLLDVTAAKAHPGVVEVITREPPAAGGIGTPRPTPSCSASTCGIYRRDAGQPIAVVIAETSCLRPSPALLSPRYEAEPARIGLDGQ